MQSFVVDEGKRMRELLDVLRREDADAADGAGVEDKAGALEELSSLIETIDNARGEHC